MNVKNLFGLIALSFVLNPLLGEETQPLTNDMNTLPSLESPTNEGVPSSQNNNPEIAIKEREIKILDQEIASLVNLRDYYTAKIIRLRNRANRYQFQGGANLEEASRLTLEADSMEKMLEQIDVEIERLDSERNELIREVSMKKAGVQDGE